MALELSNWVSADLKSASQFPRSQVGSPGHTGAVQYCQQPHHNTIIKYCDSKPIKFIRSLRNRARAMMIKLLLFICLKDKSRYSFVLRHLYLPLSNCDNHGSDLTLTDWSGTFLHPLDIPLWPGVILDWLRLVKFSCIPQPQTPFLFLRAWTVQAGAWWRLPGND